MIKLLFFIFIIFTSNAYSQSQNTRLYQNLANEKKYSISLKDWPPDLALQITELIPNISKKGHDLESLNEIIKRLDKKFNFNRLQLVQQNSSSELHLVAEISPLVKKIAFEDLSEISESDALSLMELTVNNILDEETLKVGSEKLSQFYRKQGYRFANVVPAIISENAIDKSVVFKVYKKTKTKLAQITIEGLQQIELQKKIQKKIQRKFRLPTLNEATLNLITTELRNELSSYGFYQTPVTSPQISFSEDELSAKLLFKLKNMPRYRIEIVNTRNFEHTFLEDQILNLKFYLSKEQNMVSELTEKLKEYYISKGFPHVNITTYESKKDNLTHLFFNIEEGPFTKISDFRITGQYSREENYYKKLFFELGSSNIQDRMFIKDEIEQTIKNMLISIQNEGFVSAKFSRVFISTERENPKNGVLILQLDEGTQVEIKSLKFTGVSDSNLEAVKIASQLSLKQKLSLNDLERSLESIRNYYYQAGYIEYRINNEHTDLVTYTDNNTKIDLNFQINEGPKVEVQSIVVEGNTRTNDKLVQIELDFKAGEILNPEKIDESISRLQRTGHFNSVEIQTLEKDTNIPQRTVIVRVVERDPGVRVLGVGLTDENRGTLHGYAGVAYRNFQGWGIGASFRSELNYNFADIKYLEQKHTFGFVYPYLFETRARFRASASRSNTIADVRINKVSEANTAIFSLEQDFTSHVTGILSYTVTTYKDHGIDSADEIKFGYTGESLVIGSIGPTLDFDYRNNLFNPSNGSITRLTLEYAAESLGNNNVDDFYRATGQTTHYFPFKKFDFVFVQSLRAGYIKNIDARGEGIPFDKKGFSLGGRTSIRGFESSEFFPTTSAIGASYRLKTSSSFELVKSELRFTLSEQYDLAGAFFYDGGRVKIEGVQFADEWRDAIGFGIRYNTPVGPLNLEYAHKLDKKAGESDGAFHLSVGIF